MLGASAMDVTGGLVVNNGVINGPITFRQNAVAVGTGTYNGSVQFTNNAVFGPGAAEIPGPFLLSPAVVNITGQASFAPQSPIWIQIAGTAPGQHDQVKIGGHATVAGTLNLYTDGLFFKPARLDTFTVMTFPSRSGAFTKYTGFEAPGGLSYAPIYSATDLTLTATLPGDANLDGQVSFPDLVALAQNYDTTVSLVTDNWWPRGDFNLDGKVAFDDLVRLAQNYNQGLSLPADQIPAPLAHDWPAALQQATVPEPAAMTIYAIFATCLLTRRSPRAPLTKT